MDKIRVCTSCRRPIPEAKKNQYYCTPCRTEYVKKWKSTFSPERRDLYRASQKRWQDANRQRRYEQKNAARRKRMASDPVYREKIRLERRQHRRTNLPRDAKYQRKSALKRYGLTQEVYEKILSGQNGVCALCFGSEGPSLNKRGQVVVPCLAVDHCHASGAVRGLLCKRCNATLGRWNDDPDMFIRAAAYLRRDTKGTMQ